MKTAKPQHDRRDWYEFLTVEYPPESKPTQAATAAIQTKPVQTTIDKRRVIAHN